MVSLGTFTYIEVKTGTPKSAELRTTKPRGGVHAHHAALAWSQAEGVFHTSQHAHFGHASWDGTCPLLGTTPALRDVHVHHVGHAE